MIAVEDEQLPVADRPAPPDREIADDETLQALEYMLANPDERFSCEPSPTTPGPIDRCGLVREMLARLDTLSPSGQRDVMGRIISVLATEAGEETSILGDGNRRSFCEQLDRLRHEAERPWPDAALFCKRAESLIAMVEVSSRAPTP